MWFIAENKFCEVRLWKAVVVVEVQTRYSYVIQKYTTLSCPYTDFAFIFILEICDYHCPVRKLHYISVRRKCRESYLHGQWYFCALFLCKSMNTPTFIIQMNHLHNKR